MKVREVRPDEAAGHLLMHNLIGVSGEKVIAKGRRLDASDVARLKSAGAGPVRVAVMEPGDVGENEAAQELAGMIAGRGLSASGPRGGRVDLFAETAGLFQVDPEALLALNQLPGVAIATARNHEVLPAGKRAVSVKVVPYAIPGATLAAARNLCGAPVLSVKPFVLRTAVLVTTGHGGPNVVEPTHPWRGGVPSSTRRSEIGMDGSGATTGHGASRGEVATAFGGPLRERLAGCGMEMTEGPWAREDEGEIREALEVALSGDAEMVLVAGSTSITDADDVTPRAIRAAGAEIVQFGVPVEPGSLLLLAYRGEKPIVGVPGCVRGRHRNAFDLILPRLAAGERLTRHDLLALGHGGLLG